MGEDFDYAEQLKKLDVDALKKDLKEVLCNSQDWWSADYGYYGGLMGRLSWHAAGSYRVADGRVGANGARIRLAPPKKDWMGDEPERLAKVLAVYEKLSAETNVSIADLIVLGGTVAVEKAIKDAGFNVPLQFNAGRGDAVQEMTDAKSF